eukprot:UN25261
MKCVIEEPSAILSTGRPSSFVLRMISFQSTPEKSITAF